MASRATINVPVTNSTMVTTSSSRGVATTSTISLTARHQIKLISQMYSDPSRAFHMMRTNMQSTNNILRAEAGITFCQALQEHRVGTQEVENIATRVLYGNLNGNVRSTPASRTPEMEQEVVRILQRWQRTMIQELKALTRKRQLKATELREDLSRLQTIGSREDLEELYKDETNQETSRTSRSMEGLYRSRTTWLVRKFKPRFEREEERWGGVKVTTRQLEEEKRRRSYTQGDNFMVLDDIQLSEDEKAYLGLPYKFREVEGGNLFDFEVELEVHGCKQRWDLMDAIEDDEEEDDNMTVEERAAETKRKEEEKDKTKKERAKAGEVLDIEKKEIDMTKLKVTNLKKNPRMYEPRAAKNEDNVLIEAQRLEILRRCKDLLPDPNMRRTQQQQQQQQTNLSPAEARGKKLLLRRIAEGELLVTPTDKSGKLVVCLPTTYREAAKVHLDKDQEVPWTKLPEVEREVNRHTAVLRKVLGIGSAHTSQQHRLLGALKSCDSAAPALRLVWKDHKSYQTIPPTRGICSATVGPLSRSAEVLSMITSAALSCEQSTEECRSTEEMQRAVLDANQRIREENIEGTMVMSMDVDALFPSMTLEDVLETVMELFLSTELLVRVEDDRLLAQYLVLMLSKEEIEERGLSRQMPRRTVEEEERTVRRVPGIAYLDNDTYISRVRGRQQKKPKWIWDDWVAPTSSQRKVMVALMMREQIKMVFTSHLYTFGGRLFLQASGGPIGLDLSEVVARALMRRYNRQLSSTLSRLNIKPVLHKCFVDDLDLATSKLSLSTNLWRDEAGELVLVHQPGVEGGQEEEEQHTAKILLEVANTIMPNSIQMKIDIPSNYDHKRLPILDMEMWVESNTIHHNHYAKPMASKAVIMERSAFTTKEKKNILMEEANRRLRNCDPSQPWETKRDHLTLLNIQMMEAGHSQRFRDMVTSRSVARYRNSLRNHLRKERGEEGGRWLYRTKEERAAQWAEQGGKATKANWFRRGGHTSILNVPATLGSELANRVREVFQTTTAPPGLRPGVQERPGRSVVGVLTKANPFPRESCGRRLCPWFARGEPCYERCYRESVCYIIFCKVCRREAAERATQDSQQEEEEEQEGREVTDTKEKAYIGETSNTLPTRTETHLEVYSQAMRPGRRQGGNPRRQGEEREEEEGEETSSWMADHMMEAHGGQKSEDPFEDFEFHQLRRFLKALERQVAESVYMELAETRGVVRMGPVLQRVARELCNRKGEMFHFNPRGRQPQGLLVDRGRPPG